MSVVRDDRDRSQLIGYQQGVIAQSMRGPDDEVLRAIRTLIDLVREDERAKWFVGEFRTEPMKGRAA